MLEGESSSDVTPMGVFRVTSYVVLTLLLVTMFAIGSWYGIESFLNANASQCIGPVCINGP